MPNAGVLNVRVVPIFEGGVESIVAQIVNPAAEAGAEAGARIGQGIIEGASTSGAEAGRNIAAGVAESTAAMGTEVGRNLTMQLVTQGQEGAKLVGAEIRATLIPAATEAAASAGAAIKEGVTKGAVEAATAAGDALKTGGATAGIAAGTAAGSGFNKTFVAEASSGAGALLRDLQAKVEAAAVDIGKAEYSLASARAAEQRATDAVNIAETRLLETRLKYQDGTSQVLMAEARLSDARSKADLSTQKVSLAEEGLIQAETKHRSATEDLSRAQTTHNGTLNDVEKSTVKATESTGNLVSAYGKLAPGTAGVIGQFKDLGLMLGATFAVGAVGKAVSAAGDMQAAITRLATSAGEDTKNLDMDMQGVIHYAQETGTSTGELAKGLYQINSASYHGAEGLTILHAAAQGAKAENADLGQVTKALTDLLTDYHVPAQNAADVMSKMVAATSEGKMTFEELSSSMSTVAAKAEGAHISMDDLLGSIATMTSHGVSAQNATDELAHTIQKLQSPTSQMVSTMYQYGLNANDLAHNLGKNGVQGTLEQMSEVILSKMGPAGTTLLSAFNQSKQAANDANIMYQNLPPNLRKVADEFNSGKISMNEWRQGLKALPADQAGLLTQWVGMRNNAEGFSTALKNGGNAAQSYQQALTAMTGDSTTLQVALMMTGENAEQAKNNIAGITKATAEAGGNVKGWSEIQGTFNQQLAVAKESFATMGISIGTRLLPFLTEALKGFGIFAKFLANNSDAVLAFVTTLGIFGGALLVVKSVSALAEGFKALKATTEGATIAQKALNVAQSASVMGVIALAVAALVAGLIWAYQNVDWFRNAVDGAFKFVGGAAKWLYENAIKPVFNAIGTAIGWVVDHWKIFAAAIAISFLPLTLLGAAIYEVVTHFHQIVGAISGAASAVGHFFVDLWHSAEHAFNAVRDAIVSAWQNHIKPTLDAIVTVLKYVGAIIFTILVAPFVLAWYLISAAAKAMWDHVLKPVFDEIAKAAVWVYENGIKPLVERFQRAWENLCNNVKYVWEHVLKPAWDSVVDGATWLYEHALKPIFEAIKFAWESEIRGIVIIWNDVLKPAWQAVQDAAKWLYDNVLKPVFNAIKTAWETEIRGMVAVWNDYLKPAWKAIEDAAKWLWDNILKPIFDFIGRAWSDLVHGIYELWSNTLRLVFDAVKDAVHAVGDAFDKAINWIKDTWNKLVDITKEPVNFVITTVYNHGILPTWNAIAGVFGIGKLDPMPALASGGALGGGSQWDAVGSGFKTNGPKAIVGEGDPRYPEYVIPTDPSHRDRAMGLWASLSQEIGMFASGGILGTVGSALNSAGGFIGGLATDAWHGVEDAYGWLSSIAGDALGGVTKLFGPILSGLGGMPLPFGSGGSFKDALTAVPHKVIDSVVNLVKGFFASGAGPISGGAAPPGQISAWIAEALAVLGWPENYAAGIFQQIMTESGGNPSIIQQIHDVNSGGNEARGIMQVIPPTFAANALPGHGNIFSAVDNIIAGSRYAMNRYGAGWFNPGPWHAHGYDSGGYLQPGYTSVYNGTGKPEPVFTSGQWDVLKANMKNGNGNGGGNTINVYAGSERSGVSIAHEVDRHLSRGSRLNFSM